MRLEGSCHCGKVRFSLESREPWPYQRCYCSICRKTGSGGFMINLGGDARTLEVDGEAHLKVYQAVKEDGTRSEHRRYFCGECGSHLYAQHSRWPDLVHPVASAIDTPLPAPPRRVHMMLGSRASWVPVDAGPDDERYDEYPRNALATWHADNGYDDKTSQPEE
ncbi:MAG: GFA family protein [Myxococcota bacterium]